MVANEKQIGKNIKTMRENMKITQEEFAEKLGVTRKAVSAWEVGRSFPKMQYVNKMCDIFGCKISDITDGYLTTTPWDNTPVSDSVRYDLRADNELITIDINKPSERDEEARLNRLSAYEKLLIKMFRQMDAEKQAELMENAIEINQRKE